MYSTPSYVLRCIKDHDLFSPRGFLTVAAGIGRFPTPRSSAILMGGDLVAQSPEMLVQYGWWKHLFCADRYRVKGLSNHTVSIDSTATSFLSNKKLPLVSGLPCCLEAGARSDEEKYILKGQITVGSVVYLVGGCVFGANPREQAHFSLDFVPSTTMAVAQRDPSLFSPSDLVDCHIACLNPCPSETGGK